MTIPKKVMSINMFDYNFSGMYWQKLWFWLMLNSHFFIETHYGSRMWGNVWCLSFTRSDLQFTNEAQPFLCLGISDKCMGSYVVVWLYHYALCSISPILMLLFYVISFFLLFQYSSPVYSSPYFKMIKSSIDLINNTLIFTSFSQDWRNVDEKIIRWSNFFFF